jgi:hypothetical protein
VEDAEHPALHSGILRRAGQGLEFLGRLLALSSRSMSAVA